MRSEFSRAGLVVVAFAVAVTTAACGGGREYAVPETVCGVPLAESVVSPLLPDGKELKEAGEALPLKRDQCTLDVDGTAVLYLTFVRTDEKPYDPMSELVRDQFQNRKEIRDLPFTGKGAVGDSTAMVTTQCRGKPNLIADLKVDERVTTEVPQRRADLEKFAAEYMAGARKKLDCRASGN